jgi:hypothetical protein
MYKRSLSGIIVAALIITLILLYRPIRDGLRGYFEVTSYSVGRNSDGKFTLPLNPTTYRVYPSQKRAIYWNGGDGVPDDLIECVVRDRCNWQCSFPDHSSQIRMGDCMEGPKGFGELWETRPVSWFVYWKYNLK